MALEVIGGPELLRKLQRLKVDAVPEAGASLYRSGQKIITISKERYVPVLTGALQGTLNAETPEVSGSTVVVRLTAGGPAAPYAVHVHEINKNYKHGRQWKYLETPVKQEANNVLNDLKKDLLDFMLRAGRGAS